jgi:hypothetical protein
VRGWPRMGLPERKPQGSSYLLKKLNITTNHKKHIN